MFPHVIKGQRCQYLEDGGTYSDGYVYEIFDEGFIVKRNNGSKLRFLKSKWTEEDDERLLLLTRNKEPIMRSRKAPIIFLSALLIVTCTLFIMSRW